MNLFDYLSLNLNADLSVLIFKFVCDKMKDEIEILQDECNKLRIKIMRIENNEIQSMQNNIRVDRILTSFGLSSTAEIENAKNRKKQLELSFKEKLNKKIEELNMDQMKDVYEKLKDAIYIVMDIMEDNHYKFMDILNSYKSINYD